MSHAEKSRYYRELKDAGIKFEKTYQQYTTDELERALNHYRAAKGLPPVGPEEDDTEDTDFYDESAAENFDAAFQQVGLAKQAPKPEFRPPDQDAGLRQNTPENTRLDEQGRVWYQDEIRKPPYPKPRKRRKLQYIETGSKMQTVMNGQFLESFEVAGDQHHEAEVKITLPSYQVGLYKDPRFPFKIHVYNEARGFNLFEVQDFYGGAERVPAEVKRIYVENVLCYDIRTVVRAIETEFRQQQLLQKGVRA